MRFSLMHSLYISSIRLTRVRFTGSLISSIYWGTTDGNSRILMRKKKFNKKGIELHRYKGTVWAIREALRTVGYPNATIQEHVTHWAGFTIQLNAGDTPIDSDQIAEALEMVKS